MREITIERKSGDIIFEYEVIYEKHDFGVGNYEYFGQRGTDTNIQMIPSEIWWNKNKHTPKENETINNYITKHFNELVNEY